MQASVQQLQGGVVSIVNPKANDIVSEGAWVIWKKIEQVFGFGTSSAGDLNLALEAIAATSGAKLNTVSHSAGNFAPDEMLRRLGQAGTTDAALGTVTLFGSPVNAQSTANTVNAVTSGSGTTHQSTHVNDFVGTVFGGNPATGGNPQTGAFDSHSSYTGDLTVPVTVPTAPEAGYIKVPSPAVLKKTAEDAWGKGQFSQPTTVFPQKKINDAKE